MTPIFMLKNAESRFDGRHDEFSEYMRTEYGSHESAWIFADGAKNDAHELHCGHCGRENTDGSKSCYWCGSLMVQDQKPGLAQTADPPPVQKEQRAVKN